MSNISKLIVTKMAHDAIPNNGGLKDAVKFLSNRDIMLATAKNAKAFVQNAIAAIKAAPDNPYGNDDEAIAGAILAEIAKKRTTHGQPATHPHPPAKVLKSLSRT